MRVTLIAQTLAIPMAMEDATDGKWGYPYGVMAADALGEFAGRACYQSWDRPNPSTRDNADYLEHVIEQGHESVLAHASFTFYATGVSRSLTHELIRHRWLAFSELSQRYVDITDAEPVIPPAADNDAAGLIRYAYHNARGVYVALVSKLQEQGLSRKQAREAARSVLPNATETRIVVSGNVRAWRDFLHQRLSPAADAEIRAFATEIHRQLRSAAPHSLYGIEAE